MASQRQVAARSEYANDPSTPFPGASSPQPSSTARSNSERYTNSTPQPNGVPPESTKPGSPSESTRDDVTLTPLRAHYLKKSLIEFQLDAEIDGITTAAPNNISTFSYLGPPFRPPPKETPYLDLPLLRYIFRQFVLTFPFLASAPKDFFPDKVQPFIASVLSRNLSPTSVMDENPEESEEATRMKLRAKLHRNLAVLISAGTKIVEPEEVVRLRQADLDRLEALAKRRQQRGLRNRGVFEVNVICVRTEFIIRTRRPQQHDVYVSRRYGDFKTLATELRKAHPEADIPQPPAKDRSTTNAPEVSPTSADFMPGSFARSQTMSSMTSVGSNQSFEASSPTTKAAKLSREKNRLTLRAYLTRLMSGPLANSPVLRSFLLSGPTQLSPEEVEDAKRREEADKLRDEGRKRFAKEIALRVEGLRAALRSVKGDMMGKDGLSHIFATIKEHQHVRDLPENYQAVIEWGRMSLASTVFQHLVAADNASENLAFIKRIHGLMPYLMLKTALRISNPVGMIRNILDLFLAQPFGSRSLLQRMFTSSLTEEVKALEEDIEAVKDKVDDPVLCEKVRIFVYAPPEIQAIYKADAVAENVNVLTAVLRSGEEPYLSRPQMNRVQRAHRAHLQYQKYRGTLADSDDDNGPEDEDAWLFEDLGILAKLYSKLRDREQMIELIFEARQTRAFNWNMFSYNAYQGTTADLLKDIVTIFYSPLAQVYKAANIADSVSDLQAFVTDLIKTVEQAEDAGQDDPQRTVRIFVDLIERHEQSFYSFVHRVHSKGEALFESLMHWIELFLTLVREGIGSTVIDGPVSLEFLLPHAGQERREILHEVDAVALYHYKLKVAYEEKIRRRFGRSQQQSEADAQDEAAQALVNGVVDELSFGELTHGETEDLAAEETDESDEEYSSSEESSDEYDTASEDESTEHGSPPPPPPPRQRTLSHGTQASSSRISSDKRRPPPPPLKKSRSLLSLSRKHPKSAPADTPPVPHLPPEFRNSMSKPLPSPPSQANEGRRSVGSGRPTPLRARKPKGPRPETIKPPTLIHIPQLRPIFVEMIRPILRPRQL
ncbi:hypothetical protein PUNSTDRAFT_142609 [Punctularia strigosozonata HHB-11173 SS5]|uniref:uncharacterized protein n=1 Tax=Punctularia strigosozonata (strain HHB-11173) TaxID=741275 RepID=UPI0004417712|nr:uncharacterized protein PUNSTDRAFT_142609 [Punctularia strigosozonata HHB-11173 SS5]EIN10638.1 hypothetical protein PUNSTDRAFT_142609 [Punctularia strigosozonata HHB-11173 SS5]